MSTDEQVVFNGLMAYILVRYPNEVRAIDNAQTPKELEAATEAMRAAMTAEDAHVEDDMKR